MQNPSRLALTLIASLVAGAVFAADKPVAVVNGVAIPQTKVDYILKQVAERGAKDSPELRQKIRDDLVTKEVVAQEAVKQGIDKQADVQLEAELAKQNVILKAFVQNFQKLNPVSDETLKAEYDKVKGQFPTKEYKASHILVETEKEANDILAALKKGKKFADLAKDKSKDPGSKDKGGDLNWAAPESYVKEFSEALTKLAKGQTTATPVKSQFGFHVIKLEDVREAKGPSFDELKPQLTQQVQGQALDKLLADLKAKAKVE